MKNYNTLNNKNYKLVATHHSARKSEASSSSQWNAKDVAITRKGVLVSTIGTVTLTMLFALLAPHIVTVGASAGATLLLGAGIGLITWGALLLIDRLATICLRPKL